MTFKSFVTQTSQGKLTFIVYCN